MTIYHLGALMIAAALVLGCGLSNTCSHEGMSQVIQISAVIVGGTFGHANRQGGNHSERKDT